MKYFKIEKDLFELTVTFLGNAQLKNVSYVELNNLLLRLKNSEIIEETPKEVEQPTANG